MVVIRLTRVGKKKQAHYRIVVADSHRAVKGKFISILGWYNPHTKELEVKKEELKSWLDKGARPSNTLAKLLKKEGVKLPKWVKITEKKREPKKKAEAQAKEGAGVPTPPEADELRVGKEKPEEGEAPAEEAVETLAEEAKEEKTEDTKEEQETVEKEKTGEESAESDVAEAMPDKEPKKEK